MDVFKYALTDMHAQLAQDLEQSKVHNGGLHIHSPSVRRPRRIPGHLECHHLGAGVQYIGERFLRLSLSSAA